MKSDYKLYEKIVEHTSLGRIFKQKQYDNIKAIAWRQQVFDFDFSIFSKLIYLLNNISFFANEKNKVS